MEKWNPLESSMYSTVWTVEWDGLVDRAIYLHGKVESIGKSNVFHSMDCGMGRIGG